MNTGARRAPMSAAEPSVAVTEPGGAENDSSEGALFEKKA